MTAAPAVDAATVPAIAIDRLRFRWRPDRPWVLDIAAFSLAAGERLFLAGPSGCGKSTLLAIAAGIQPVTAGQITVLGAALNSLSGAARDRWRADHVGVIFQLFNLLPYLSVLDNVLLPCRFSNARRARAAVSGPLHQEARRLLAYLGLDEPGLEQRRTAELSVGQQQRVAAARALIGRPQLIIADEPTSALDTDRRLDFVRLLGQECASVGAALLFVSHDRTLAPHFDRVVELPTMNAATGF